MGSRLARWLARTDKVGEIESSLTPRPLKRGCSISTARSTCATTAHLTCTYALRVMVNTSSGSFRASLIIGVLGQVTALLMFVGCMT